MSSILLFPWVSLLIVLGAASGLARAAETKESLIHASRVSDLDGVMRAVGAGIPVDTRDLFGSNTRDNLEGATPLGYAAFHGELELVKWLINRGAKIDAVSTRGDSALNYAIRSEARPVLDLLLGRGAKIRPGVMIDAVAADHLELVQTFVKKGADINGPGMIPTSGRPFSPLSLAASSGGEELVAWLVKNGAQINKAPVINGTAGATPLLAAVGENRINIAELLLRLGANLHISGYNFMNGDDVSPLYVAVSERNIAMIRLLMEHHPSQAHIAESLKRARNNWNGVKPEDAEIIAILTRKPTVAR